MKLGMNPRILVCGGRNFSNRELVYETLDLLYNQDFFGKMTIIEGGALGADRLAQDWAMSNDVDLITVPAEWDKYGKKAGMLRNKQMAEMQPDLCIAFKGGNGTVNMITQCREKSILCELINWEIK